MKTSVEVATKIRLCLYHIQYHSIRWDSLTTNGVQRWCSMICMLQSPAFEELRVLGSWSARSAFGRLIWNRRETGASSTDMKTQPQYYGTRAGKVRLSKLLFLALGWTFLLPSLKISLPHPSSCITRVTRTSSFSKSDQGSNDYPTALTGYIRNGAKAKDQHMA